MLLKVGLQMRFWDVFVLVLFPRRTLACVSTSYSMEAVSAARLQAETPHKLNTSSVIFQKIQCLQSSFPCELDLFITRDLEDKSGDWWTILWPFWVLGI